MMAKVCAVERGALVGTLPPRTGVSSRSDDTWLLEGISSIIQRIVAKILKSCEKPILLLKAAGFLKSQVWIHC